MPAPAILANPWVKAGLFSVGGKLLSGLFGNRAKKKQAEAQRKATIGAAELKNQMSEDTRTAQQAAGQSIMRQLASKGFTNIDPATAAQLAQRRSYDFSKGVPEAGAGLGSELLSGLFGSIGDVASQYAINRGSGGSGRSSSDIFRTGEPVGGLDTSFQGALGTGGGAFGAGGVGPQGVQLEDLRNLYKLGGSGTQDFG